MTAARGLTPDAARALRTYMASKGFNNSSLAREAKLDPGTIGDLLNGARVPQASTLAAIERVLEMPAGSISELVAGGTWFQEVAAPSAVTATPQAKLELADLRQLPTEALLEQMDEVTRELDRAEAVARQAQTHLVDANQRVTELTRRLYVLGRAISEARHPGNQRHQDSFDLAALKNPQPMTRAGEDDDDHVA